MTEKGSVAFLGFLIIRTFVRYKKPPTMTMQTNIAGDNFYEIII